MVATVSLPLGDITSSQLRALADLAKRFVKDTIRTTVEQNIVLRWVSEEDLPQLYVALKEIGLGEPGAGTIVDITACPGTDTCKLGISLFAGTGRRAEQAAGGRKPACRQVGSASSHQGQWLFQLLRAASRCGSGFLWSQSPRRGLHGSPFSGGSGRPMD